MILQKFILMLNYHDLCFSCWLIFWYMNAEQKHLTELIDHMKILLNQLDFSQVSSLHSAALVALLHSLDHSVQSVIKTEIIAWSAHEKELLHCECHVIHYLIQQNWEFSFWLCCSHQFLSQQLLSLCDHVLNHLMKLWNHNQSAVKIQHSVICQSLYAAFIALIECDVLAVCQQVDYCAHWVVRFISQKFLLLLKKMFLLCLVLIFSLTEWKQNLHFQHSHTIDYFDQHE